MYLYSSIIVNVWPMGEGVVESSQSVRTSRWIASKRRKRKRCGCLYSDKVEKSALSMHAKECHIENFSLETFSISVVKKVSPQQLRREEFKFIDKFRTAPLGLNRYKS